MERPFDLLPFCGNYQFVPVEGVNLIESFCTNYLYLHMLKKFFILLVTLSFINCSPVKEPVDLIIHNATIYAVDSAFSIYEAMAVKGGRIVSLNSSREILANYDASKTIDAHKKPVYPGFIDAHCHFMSYGIQLGRINLVGTKSLNEVVDRVQRSAQKKLPNIEAGNISVSEKKENHAWLVGRGWDQNDWENKSMPSNKKLDSLFPDRPVFLTRIDGHAALVNSKALTLAGVNSKTRINGGEIVVSNNKPTGLLVDNAVDLVRRLIPSAGNEDKKGALLNAQNNCLEMGLTTLDDAGLMKDEIDMIDSLQKNGKLKIRIYAMLADSLPNYEYYLEKGPYKTDRLNVRSFKFYADGALGSRGACLFKEYADKPGWKGFLLNSKAHFTKYAALMDARGFQMNTHCIGDSALNLVMNIYSRYCNEKPQHRWRIEHAQVFTGEDFKNFSSDIIPSVQPTHATSDMYWAETRLGKERLKNAYAYQMLVEAAGMIALGTDFPVEDISPFKTFYAAVARKDSAGFPPGGFQIENALTRKQTLRGMTIWAAYANFEEKEKGSLEPGKFADFVVLDHDIMKCEINEVPETRVLATYIDGEAVYSCK
jgi:predicted amidohydrolase YtcJ